MSRRQTRQTIVQLLSNMSDGKEIRAYLQRFSEVDRSRFAVIKIGGAVLADALEETAAALAFLHTVGLTPIVIHGGGPQLDAALDAAGVETVKRDGLRVTDGATLDVARRVFVDENIRLVEAVRARGVEAHSVNAGAIEATYLDRDLYGFVGEPTSVRLDLIRSVVGSGAIPVLSCLGVAAGGQIVNVNADAATRALVSALEPLKIIFLTGVGGLLGEDGAPIHSISLASDFDRLMGEEWVHSGMRLKLQEIKRLLDAAPISTSVSITRPEAMIRELFTHGGAGTLIRRGERIYDTKNKADVDAARFTAMVEKAFARPLKPNWWKGVRPSRIFASESYRAGALIREVGGVSYLDKFAVVDEARGEGLARALWRRLSVETPLLYWRSRTENGFNAFYADAADGSAKIGPWTVFWRGEHDLARAGPIVDTIARLPDSFASTSGETED